MGTPTIGLLYSIGFGNRTKALLQGSMYQTECWLLTIPFAPCSRLSLIKLSRRTTGRMVQCLTPGLNHRVPHPPGSVRMVQCLTLLSGPSRVRSVLNHRAHHPPGSHRHRARPGAPDLRLCHPRRHQARHQRVEVAPRRFLIQYPESLLLLCHHCHRPHTRRGFSSDSWQHLLHHCTAIKRRYFRLHHLQLHLRQQH